MKNFVILVPPSEAKMAGGSEPSKKLSKESQYIVNQWKGVSKAEWGKLLSVKGKVLDKAVEINKNVLNSKTISAIERYKGVVYNGIDYSSLKVSAKKYLDLHVRIVSALYGLLQAKDLIADYKCKINNFSADQYWRPVNKDLLKDVFVVDLLPQAHRKAVEYSCGVVIEFHFVKNGKKIPAGHHGKLIKGRYIRWLATEQVSNEKDLKAFQEDGFKWHENSFVKIINDE